MRQCRGQQARHLITHSKRPCRSQTPPPPHAQERCEPGVCKVARYHGPLVLELKPDVPGVPRASAERFAPAAPACPAFQAAAATRLSTGDVDLLAADGSRQRVHKLVLQCRLPVLQGQPVPVQASQVRLRLMCTATCSLLAAPHVCCCLPCSPTAHSAHPAVCPTPSCRCACRACQTAAACSASCSFCTWMMSAARRASQQHCTAQPCAAACSAWWSCVRHSSHSTSSCSS